MKRILFLTAFLLTLSAGPAVKFKPPALKERLQAIGSTDGLAKTLSRALEPGTDFEPIPVPKSGDWLAVHRETGQTFDAFVKSRPNRPTKSRSKIYLQPLGEFPKAQVPLVETLTEYAAGYFTMQVELLPSLALSDSNVTTRINQFTKNRQILTGDILAILRRNLPADAFCLLAITMEDLYPDASWNFVFGQASFRERVGVYSFARYDPAFYGRKREKNYEKIVLRRSCRVLAHETGHMFGLKHCIYFKCVLNGSNHLQESDARPLHLCPVCLRKIQYSIGFDVASRYRNLRRFYQKADFNDETRWLTHRLERIVGKAKGKE
ncbi:MAG: archaemetzincin [Planctomycetota bacterium]|jgi:archaemetzincin